MVPIAQKSVIVSMEGHVMEPRASVDVKQAL